jgi:hypothetical protein
MSDPKSMLVDIVKELVRCLVAGNVDAVEQMTNGVRLPSDEIEAAIKDYGGTLVVPPGTAFDQLDAIEVQGSDPRRWSVRFDLWTEEEGASDLSLELTVEEGSPRPRVELDNLHVL